jgi:hypothetical protein
MTSAHKGLEVDGINYVLVLSDALDGILSLVESGEEITEDHAPLLRHARSVLDEVKNKTPGAVKKAVLRTYLNNSGDFVDRIVEVSEDHDFSKGPYQDTVPFCVGSNQYLYEIQNGLAGFFDKPIIKKLEVNELAGDWHDKPLRYAILGMVFGPQKFSTKKDAEKFVRCYRKAVNTHGIDHPHMVHKETLELWLA